MPRVNLGRNTANEKLVALIWGMADVRGLTNEQLGDKANISRTTVARRKAKPEDLTLGELLRLGRALGIPIEELREAIRYSTYTTKEDILPCRHCTRISTKEGGKRHF